MLVLQVMCLTAAQLNPDLRGRFNCLLSLVSSISIGATIGITIFSTQNKQLNFILNLFSLMALNA
jgi:hypothetical protein